MLVTFSCAAYENITLFGHVAQRLLAMMGHSNHVPGAILAKDVPGALNQLQQALEQEKQVSAPIDANDDDEADTVSIAKRAVPMVALLQAAIKKNVDVMWA